MTSHRALLLILLSTTAVAGAGCAKPVEPKSTTLHVIEHAETDTLQHVGKPDEKDSLGDILAFYNPLYDESNANKVGTSSGACFRTAIGSAYECIWTATVPGGQLTAEGPFYDGKDSTLAITGGTGDYDQARGQMALHSRNAQGTEYDFIYSIKR
ncbi:allene oxide cyclase family protein [Mycolicibacterium sphagni]|uniref:allene-oxide cyclase n=1 Tax=Mycolicibacterium sphagni TaxID=1786 RepID=A0ABX2JRV5_9MYCO|nr:allene oxide cyclase family protein [Mycolicibacterium sphagni]NTY60443.1 Allene oxide cyclase [Mycolicibacterium sphagni]